MKKIITLLLLAVTMSAFAEVYPTKFLGIPIDGTKEEMVKKLQQKGYRYDSSSEYLSGEFNGEDVHIYIATDNNKVWRVFVSFMTPRDESQIRLAYNKLFNQFSNNKKYFTADLNQTTISDKENISYEMTVHNKSYAASFLQKTHELDSTITKVAAVECMELVKQAQRENGEIISPENHEALAVFCTYEGLKANYENNIVWFTISRIGINYYISLYYDNLYNQANGEDL